MRKHLFFFLLSLSLPILACIFSSCCDEAVKPTTCIADKIEAFKLETSASSIYEIGAPDGKLYWFQHTCADCGDYVYTADCTEICVTNVEGYDPGMAPPCKQVVFDSPRRLIWEQ